MNEKEKAEAEMKERIQQAMKPELTGQQILDALAKMLNNNQTNPESEWAIANTPFKTEQQIETEKMEQSITKPSIDIMTQKTLESFKTYTFLDTMFINSEDKSIDGIPFGSNIVVVGVPNTGKSLLIMELALQVANKGKRVCFCTSEEAWKTETPRYDLEARFQERAKMLGLDWNIIAKNLFVLDVVSFAEMRDFSDFVSKYRFLVEKEKIDLLLLDSLTMLEDSRNQVKYRLGELCKYNQSRGVTAIFVSQRSGEDADSVGSIAGGISLSHTADILMCMDSKRLSSWDGTLKLDTDSKQGEEILFFHILKNRISRYRANYMKYIITKDGLVRLQPKLEPNP